MDGRGGDDGRVTPAGKCSRVHGYPTEKIECPCRGETEAKRDREAGIPKVETIATPIPECKFVRGIELMKKWAKESSLPPSLTPEFRGPVRFQEDLSWAHGSGHEVEAGQVGLVAWQFGERLAVWVDGVLLYAVPVDAVAMIASPAPGENPARENAGNPEIVGVVAQQELKG